MLNSVQYNKENAKKVWGKKKNHLTGLDLFQISKLFLLKFVFIKKIFYLQRKCKDKLTIIP